MDEDMPPYLTTKEVAAILKVDPKTISRWVLEGRLNALRTPGGHYRFTREYVRKLIAFPGDAHDQAV